MSVIPFKTGERHTGEQIERTRALVEQSQQVLVAAQDQKAQFNSMLIETRLVLSELKRVLRKMATRPIV